MAENYDLIFGQGASSQYAWSDSDYQNGWQTVGSTPPTAEQFDALQRRSDTKAKELNDRLTPIETNNTHDYRQPSTAYVVGNIAYHASLPTGYYLECTTRGTTSRGDLTISSPRIGGTVSDGTVKWQIRKGVTLPYELPSFMETLLDDKDAKTARATLGVPSTTGANASGSWNINAATAAKLATPRKIELTGNATGAATFDGSGDVSADVTVNESEHAAVADVVSNAIHPRGVYGNSGYIFYGTLTIPQTGDFFKLEVLGGNGFNSEIGQSREGTLYFRTGNYTPSHYAAYSEYHRNGAGGLKFFVVKDSGTQYRIYGGLVNYTGTMQVIPYVGQKSSFDLALTNVSALPDGADEVEQQQLIYAGTVNNFAPTKTGGGASGTWGIDISGNAASADSATNADKVDGIHAASMFYDKGNWDADNWATIGTYQVSNNSPVSGAHNWGQVISSSTKGARFQLYAAAGYSGIGCLHYRTGFEDTKRNWNTILDSENYNLFAPTKTGDGASGTWGISISGNAATATKLATARKINITGNATGSATFDGSGNISISTNVNTATNADKLDGAHLADVYRQVGGHNTPTITSIIDWNTMKACNGGTDVRNINNTTYGVTAYGGDSDFSSGVLNGYERGSFYLTQDYTNFDKLCFLFCNDSGGKIGYTMVDVFLLNYIMTNYSIVNLVHDDSVRWYVKGYSNKGTEKYKVSTKRIISAPSWDPRSDQNNCGIIDVLGIKY